MSEQTVNNLVSARKDSVQTGSELQPPAYVVTGPTSGYGRATALEIARHGTVVLAGRSPRNLAGIKDEIERKGGRATVVECDLSDVDSARRAAAEIAGRGLRLAGLVNNAGVMETRPTKNARGWDMSYATNFLGPFALTEALAPHLPEGANVVFIVSGVEDPGRKPARIAGFRGGRYISAEASACGEWAADGSKKSGYDAYATSKQCALAASLELAREMPRLRFNAVEPGFNPGTGLGRDAPAPLRMAVKYLLSPFAPHLKYWSTPERSAPVITQILLNADGVTGMYFDERGKPMAGSAQVSEPEFQKRVVTEARLFLRAH